MMKQNKSLPELESILFCYCMIKQKKKSAGGNKRKGIEFPIGLRAEGIHHQPPPTQKEKALNAYLRIVTPQQLQFNVHSSKKTAKLAVWEAELLIQPFIVMKHHLPH